MNGEQLVHCHIMVLCKLRHFNYCHHNNDTIIVIASEISVMCTLYRMYQSLTAYDSSLHVALHSIHTVASCNQIEWETKCWLIRWT